MNKTWDELEVGTESGTLRPNPPNCWPKEGGAKDENEAGGGGGPGPA